MTARDRLSLALSQTAWGASTLWANLADYIGELSEALRTVERARQSRQISNQEAGELADRIRALQTAARIAHARLDAVADDGAELMDCLRLREVAS